MLKQWYNRRALMDSGAYDLVLNEEERQELEEEHELVVQAHSDIRRQAADRRTAHRARRLVGPDD
jgi:hypothetical protein